MSASAWIICVLTKNNSVSGDRNSRDLVLSSHTKTYNLVLLYDLRDLMGNISSMMTKHIVVQHRLHRFAYLIIQTILYYLSYFTHAILPHDINFMSPAPELNTGNVALAETISGACLRATGRTQHAGSLCINWRCHWQHSYIAVCFCYPEVTLRWRHRTVMASQIIEHLAIYSTACST